MSSIEVIVQRQVPCGDRVRSAEDTCSLSGKNTWASIKRDGNQEDALLCKSPTPGSARRLTPSSLPFQLPSESLGFRIRFHAELLSECDLKLPIAGQGRGSASD